MNKKRYNKKQIYEMSKELIEKHNLFFISDITALLPIARSTFYKYFKPDSKEMAELQAMLEKNRVTIKSAIRAKLFQSVNAANLLSLYRLICTPEERKYLNQQYIDHTSDGKGFLPNIVVDTEAQKKELAEFITSLNKPE